MKKTKLNIPKKIMNFKEMAITQNAGMCSYLTIAWAVPILNAR